jgi:hypothetical protein
MNFKQILKQMGSNPNTPGFEPEQNQIKTAHDFSRGPGINNIINHFSGFNK